MAHYDIIVKGRLQGEEWRGIWTFKTRTLSDFEQTLQEAADWLRSAYSLLGMVNMSSQWEAYGCDYRAVDEPGFASIPLAWGRLFGLDGGEMLDRRNAILLQLKSPTQAPNRGRKFLNGWTEAANGPDGRPAASFRAVVQEMGNDIVAFNAGGTNPLGEFVVARRGLKGVVVASNRIASAGTSAKWARLTSRDSA